MKRLSDLELIIGSLDESGREKFNRRLRDSLREIDDEIKSIRFEELCKEVFLCSLKSEIEAHRKVIAYGAGNAAHKHLEEFTGWIQIDEIWDLYSDAEEICGIPVRKPSEKKEDCSIIIFLEDERIRRDVCDRMAGIGFDSIYFFKDFLINDGDRKFVRLLSSKITDLCYETVREMTDDYEVLDDNSPQVLYSVLPRELKRELWPECTLRADFPEKLEKDIFNSLKLDIKQQNNIKKAINELESAIQKSGFEAAAGIETFLRSILFGSIKTKDRPIRMRGDYPYDSVAVVETYIILIKNICGEEWEKAVSIGKKIRKLNKNSICLTSALAYFLCRQKLYEEALVTVREALHKGPDDFVANEMFYYVAKECKSHDIYVEEPVCDYDLNDYFCWCGMNYAWCGGYDYERNDAAFAPCFRPSCVAAPKGDFFSGEEWQEFRKSLIDGTFKYCQKSQCPNIVGRWLPRKDKCTDETVRMILNGKYDTVPNLDELHLSYDSHCNLRCPSCRVEICTNTAEQNKKYDDFYFKYLQHYVKEINHLCLQGCGEAMLSPHSRKILESFNETEYSKLNVELRTNATSITPRNWESIGEGRKRIRHIAASIDAATKESFEKIRYPAKWEVVNENLRFIQQLRISGEIDLFEFHVVVQKDNLEELTDIIRLAAGLDVDVVTFSRMLNWMGKSEEEYLDVNPYWIEADTHGRLTEIVEEIKSIRDKIERGVCEWLPDGRKMYINLPFIPDPNDSYDPIRYGRLKIR